MSVNVFLVPLVFLYIDFYVPLVFIYFFFIVVFLFFVFFLFELKYKFLVDFVAEQFRYMFFSGKFFDVSINSFVLSFFNFCDVLGYVFSFFFSGFGIRMVVVIVFVLMFFV